MVKIFGKVMANFIRYLVNNITVCKIAQATPSMLKNIYLKTFLRASEAIPG